jgi:hypothetical protein
MRMIASVAPPADHGTTILIGSAGCHSWASADVMATPDTVKASAAIVARRETSNMGLSSDPVFAQAQAQAQAQARKARERRPAIP